MFGFNFLFWQYITCSVVQFLYTSPLHTVIVPPPPQVWMGGQMTVMEAMPFLTPPGGPLFTGCTHTPRSTQEKWGHSNLIYCISRWACDNCVTSRQATTYRNNKAIKTREKMFTLLIKVKFRCKLTISITATGNNCLVLIKTVSDCRNSCRVCPALPRPRYF